MNFLHPWAIGIGAAALLLPVAIHFLTRPRPQSMPLSTIRFVQLAVNQRRSRNLLRDLLVLLLRGLAIGCIAWAFAQPRLTDAPMETIDASTRVSRVVILDASQSMSATQSGIDGFQLARVQASKFLNGGLNTRTNLIVAAANPESVFESPSSNTRILTDSLANATARPERIDIQAAINAAAEMLGTSSGNEQQEVRRELIVISDFQRTNWATVDFGPLPKDTIIELESTASDETLNNIAITSVGFAEKPTAGNLAPLEIAIDNFSKNATRVQVQVSLAENVFVVEGDCPPNVRTVLSQDILVAEAGWQSGWAELMENEDSLTADDRYPFVVQSIRTPTCTIITRQPPSQRPSSSYFLERALAPSERANGQMTIERIGPGRFGLDAVAASQLLIFDHPGRLQANQIKSLASLIRRGRGVLYVASELVDATNLKMLYDELDSDLRAPVEFLPPPRGVKRKSLSIDQFKENMRPFNVFGDSVTAMLSDLRFSGGLATRRVPNTLDDDILATLSDQSVLLFSSQAGMGNLSVLNADLNDSNLPRHRAFVPLLNELVEGLLRSNNQSQDAYCGEPLTRILPASVTSIDNLEISEWELSEGKSSDDGTEDSDWGELRQSGDGIIWNWRRPTGPAVIQFAQDNLSTYKIAVHIPSEESDLRTLDAAVLTDRLAGGREINFHRVADSDQGKDNSWIWFAIGAMAALIGEVIVLRVFKA